MTAPTAAHEQAETPIGAPSSTPPRRPLSRREHRLVDSAGPDRRM